MSENDEIEHAEILGHLSGLETHKGFPFLQRHFEAEVAALLDRMVRTAPDADLPKQRAAYQTALTLSPKALVESLITKHRNGAANQAPRVPRTTR